MENKEKEEVNIEEERKNTEEENIRGHYIQRIKDLEAELEKERKEKQELQTSYENLKVLYDTLLLDKNTIEEEKNSMEEEFRKEKEAFETYKLEQQKVVEDNTLLEKIKASHQKEINDYIAAAEATDIEVSNLHQKLGVLEKEKLDFDEKYNVLKTKYDELKENLPDSDVEETLRNEIERLENELENKNNDDEIQNLKNKYDQELQEKDEEMTRLINTNESLSKQVDELKEQSIDLDKYVPRSEYDSVRQDALQAEKRVTITTSNLQQAKREQQEQKEEYEKKIKTFADRIQILERRIVLLEGKREQEIEDQLNNDFLGSAISSINETENFPDPESIKTEESSEDIPESLRDFFNV